MLKHFFSHRTLASQTPLSHFVLNASSAEKKKVYNKVIQQAAEEQRALIERVGKTKPENDRVAA